MSSKVTSIGTPAALAQQQQKQALAARAADPWLQLPQAARDRAATRELLISAVLQQTALGVSPRKAAALVMATINSKTASPLTLKLAAQCDALSAATLERWTRQYMQGGLLALADKRRGRQRKDGGWELRAVALWQDPNRRYYSTIAMLLREEGFGDVTEKQVSRYLQSLPSHHHETAPKRMGRHYYDQNVRAHHHRTTDGLPVGFIYQADGHCCDVYVAHPVNGTHYRPELTIWIDIRSRYITGWWLSEAESAETTLFSLSSALVDQDHVPAYVHVDPGSGFKARLITDDVSGFLARFAIQAIFALPGNAKGKGLIESLWRWFEEWTGKRFATYCGHCRTDDALSRLQHRIKKGELQLPSYNEYVEAVRAFVDYWNGHAMDTLDGHAPKELWAGLERVTLETPAAAVCRPRKICTVQRWSIKLRGRIYRSAELQAYETRQVLVEYQLQTDAEVSLYDTSGRLIAIAPLVEKKPWLSDSHIQEGQQRRLAGQQKRLQDKADEALARSRGSVIDAAFGVAGALYDSNRPLPEAPPTQHVDSAALEQLQRQMDAPAAAATDESMFDRYARWQQLSTAQARGDALSAADASWLISYTQTSEFLGLSMAYDQE